MTCRRSPESWSKSRPNWQLEFAAAGHRGDGPRTQDTRARA
jgi:hypothetical protein